MSDILTVFSRGYIDVPKSSTYDFKEKAFFRMLKPDTIALSAGDELLFCNQNVFRLDGFWQYIITSYHEEHKERCCIHNTLSNSVSVFSLGANPVQVSLEGLMLMDGSTDHLAQFFELYVKLFRAKRLRMDARILDFHLKDTSFYLLIDSLSVRHTTEIEGYALVSMQGVAWHYAMTGLSDGLNLGYYGRNNGVPTGKKTPDEKAVQELTMDEIAVVGEKE